MFRKIFTLVVVILFLSAPLLFAEERSSSTDYKIKRLVSELHDTRRAAPAERRLYGYDERATQYLLPLIKDDTPDNVKIAVLRVMAKIGDASVEDDIVPLLRDSNKRIRQQAAKTLGMFAVKESTIEPLKRLLSDYDAEVRFNAIRTLSKLARKDDVEIYVVALGDYDPRVRKFAVNALGEIKDPATVPHLAQMVRDYHPEVRMELSKTLKQINDETCIEPLLILTRDIDPKVRLFAVKYLCETNLPGTEQALIAVTNNADPNLASKAIVALGKTDSEQALEIAKAHLDDEHLVVKLAAIEVLGLKGGNDEISKLRSFETAESTLVRERASEALVQAQSRI